MVGNSFTSQVCFDYQNALKKLFEKYSAQNSSLVDNDPTNSNLITYTVILKFFHFWTNKKFLIFFPKDQKKYIAKVWYWIENTLMNSLKELNDRNISSSYLLGTINFIQKRINSGFLK